MSKEKFSERSKRSWSESTSGEKFNIMPIIMLIVSAPILIVLTIVFGIFTVGSLISFLTNIWVLSAIVLFNVLLFVFDRLSLMSSVVIGLIIAVIAYIYPLIQTCIASGIFCVLTAGVQAIITGILVLPGMALGAILVSGLTGLFLWYIK